MSIEKNLFKLDNLIELSNLLLKNGFSNDDMVISIHVHSDELMHKINEELYYKSSEENKETLPQDNIDEIDVNVGGIKYKYVKK